MSEEIFEQVACLSCGSLDYTSITNVGQFNIATNVVLCKSCGFMFLSPRWTKARYDSFYINEYENYYPRQSDAKELSYKLAKLIADRLTSFNNDLAYNNILDIGCGFGDTLLYLKEFHFPNANYHAIEPSKVCIDYLRQNDINIISETVDSDWHTDNRKRFDLIIMRHVLEHFLDPNIALRKVAEALKEEGIAYIAVPDAYHPISPLNNYYFRAVHVSYFNKDSISSFVESAGLEILELKDNLNGELFLIAKKSITKKDKHPFNIYDKQMEIIKSTYAKENETNKIQQPSYLNRLTSFIKRTIKKPLNYKK